MQTQDYIDKASKLHQSHSALALHLGQDRHYLLRQFTSLVDVCGEEQRLPLVNRLELLLLQYLSQTYCSNCHHSGSYTFNWMERYSDKQ